MLRIAGKVEILTCLLAIGSTWALSGCGEKESKSNKDLVAASVTETGSSMEPKSKGDSSSDPTFQVKKNEEASPKVENDFVQAKSNDLQAEIAPLSPAEKLNWDENRKIFDNRKYEQITPTGEKIMAAAIKWQMEQAKSENARIYAQPAQCAQNISKVLAIAGLFKYKSPLVPNLIDAIRKSGGLVISLPKNARSIAHFISTKLGSKIPTGTIVGGCLYQDCSGVAGDGHVGVVGDIDETGALKIYHNNWYRPDNENGVWKKHMVPLSWYNAGFLRKFMSTPWINIFRNPPRVGMAYDISIELPAVDDLDPTNYYVTLAVPREILEEVKNKSGKTLDSLGNQVSMKK